MKALDGKKFVKAKGASFLHTFLPLLSLSGPSLRSEIGRDRGKKTMTSSIFTGGLPGIHYFDAHCLNALLLNAPELQLHPLSFPEPEEAGDAVDDPSSDEELSTTDGEDTSDDDDSFDPKLGEIVPAQP